QDFPVYADRKEFDLSATILPAREVGGDFYDFFFVDQDRLCLCIGDVSGKGVPAALFMAVGKTLIKSRGSSDNSPASIMTYVNDALCEGNESCMFITLFLAFLNVKTGELVYTNAGHNPPNIRKNSGEVTRLAERHGPVAGAVEGLAFKESCIKLEEGDALVLFTDGVTEAMDPNEALFEEHRLESLLASQAFADSQSLNQAIMTSVKDFEQDAGQADDITILSLIFNGDPDAGCGKHLETALINNLEQMSSFQDAFEAFAEQAGLSLAVQSQVAMVFDELLNNTISYGYHDDDEHTIDIQVDVYPSYLSVVIRDDGIPFNPFSLDDPDTTLSIEEREIGGLGVHLVRNVMDDVSYERKVNQNVLTLIKRFEE
ncbi:MAG: SpoIIE family protein phosphatase, partial [Desulfuromusa sp.]|nr:SpoIIE family protein phosphatase [Desulfuromusa sp.]